jgi:hypothetical protein
VIVHPSDANGPYIFAESIVWLSHSLQDSSIDLFGVRSLVVQRDVTKKELLGKVSATPAHQAKVVKSGTIIFV